MNLLAPELIENNTIRKTGESKYLNIGNRNEIYEVYEIPLDHLYYNDQNDRIATWISQYKIENNCDGFGEKYDEEYNQLIHGFIEESNPEKLKETQRNIELIGQQHPGVVLKDGRIIDGNRRYTCLRNIAKETTLEKQYFKAFILKQDIKNAEKDIKILELRLQHGEDEKVDYNPIDKLVGIYHDITETEMFTIEEYAKAVNQKENVIKKDKEIADLMVEFLEFISKPKQFYLARTLQLDGPLRELYGILKKCKNDDEKEDMKNAIFATFVAKPIKDMTRYTRKIKNIAANDELRKEYIEEQRDIVEAVYDLMENENKLTVNKINEIREENEEILRNLEKTTEKYVEKANIIAIKNEPLQLIQSAFNKLDGIDTNIFKKLTSNEIEDIKEAIKEVEEKILEIKDGLDV